MIVPLNCLNTLLMTGFDKGLTFLVGSSNNKTSHSSITNLVNINLAFEPFDKSFINPLDSSEVKFIFPKYSLAFVMSCFLPLEAM